MALECENTVPSENQLSADARIRGEGNGHPRILFLGNSVTLHGPAAHIGWHGDWGMAASAEENDYVHVFMKTIREKHPDASFRIGQLADWERAFWRDEEVLADFQCLRDWQPDYICSVILGANTPGEALDEHDFEAHYRTMLRYFNPEGKARVAATTMFWENARKDEAIRKAVPAEGAILVEMNDLGVTDEMMALNEYEHKGVAAHPGDLGMRTMAERLINALQLA